MSIIVIEFPRSSSQQTMNSTAATGLWHRCYILLLALLFVTLFSLHADGQEISTVADETVVAIDADATVVASDGMEDVADSGDMMEDAIAQLNESSDADNIISTEGFVDDVLIIEDETLSGTATDVDVTDREKSNNTGSSTSTTESNNDDAESFEDIVTTEIESETKQESQAEVTPVVQAGPFIDLLGDMLLSLEMVDEAHAQVHQHYTNEALSGKKVVGLYFSADWCGPCRQFTPDLVNFYNKMNSRRGKKDEFEIVWISRCRTVDAFGQYFTQMNWLALPPNEAMGQRGQYLGDKFKVKSIPTLVLLDEIGNIITTDGRNKIPMDMAGIGFPWRSPISILVSTLVPRSFRLLAKSQISGAFNLVKRVIAGRGNTIKEALKGANTK